MYGAGIKVIVCDLDHTLLNSNKQISAQNLSAIKACKDKGIFVTICSGRIFTMLETYERDLEINGPLITTNGAAIVDSRDNAMLWSSPIDRSDAIEVLDYAKSQNFDYSALTGNKCFFSQNSKRINKFIQYNEIAESQGIRLIPLEYLNGDNHAVRGDIYKILISEYHPGQIDIASEHLANMDGIGFTKSEAGLLDIMAPHVDKGIGLRELKRILKVEKHEVCVFGDYINDLPMFEEAGLPIAMANADETVKAKALIVTDSNNDNGVANAIYRYIL
jgi:Cof subfamily protein (haloacid dehalogenase superfamily)